MPEPLYFRKVPARLLQDGQLSPKLADIIFRRFGRPVSPTEPPVRLNPRNGTDWLQGLCAGLVDGSDKAAIREIIDALSAGDSVDIW